MSKLSQTIAELPEGYREWVVWYLNNKIFAIATNTVIFDKDNNQYLALYELGLASAFGRHVPVKEEHLQLALDALSKQIASQSVTEVFNEKYGQAVSYFYNNAGVDSNGIYLLLSFGRKKYFTRFELDEINRKYAEVTGI